MTLQKILTLIIALMIGSFFSVAHAEESDSRSIDAALKKLLQEKSKEDYKIGGIAVRP